jgi:prepilin-type N-terminal cleavage/methylation domain-containing protein
MKILTQPKRERRGRPSWGRDGFTMVEVAIALGVIAIALVAIIGVLPTGLQVQQENREDTLMNQDGLILLEAIRNGRELEGLNGPNGRPVDWPNGLDYLTNHVLGIVVANVEDGPVLWVNPRLTNPQQPLRPFGNALRGLGVQGTYRTRYDLTNGLHMIGLLGRPKLEVRNGVQVTNYVAALMRSISGPATAQGSVGRDLAFTYVVESEVAPLGHYPRSWIDYGVPGLTADQILVRSNRFMRAVNQGANFSQLTLNLWGPALESTRNGERRWRVYNDPMVMRTVLSGRLYSYPVQNDPEFAVSYVLPGGYQRVTP